MPGIWRNSQITRTFYGEEGQGKMMECFLWNVFYGMFYGALVNAESAHLISQFQPPNSSPCSVCIGYWMQSSPSPSESRILPDGKGISRACLRAVERTLRWWRAELITADPPGAEE
jgi:hypothetical protein